MSLATVDANIILRQFLLALGIQALAPAEATLPIKAVKYHRLTIEMKTMISK
jgi:hypothetical protein